MFSALLYKEWIKLRYAFFIPCIVYGALLFDWYFTMNAIQNNHGPIALWADLIEKHKILFGRLIYAFAFMGIWLACIQCIPECTQKRLRLLFHLPIAHKKALRTLLLVGTASYCVHTLIIGVCFFGILAVFQFPMDLQWAMAYTILPWILLGLLLYYAFAGIIAEPALIRKALLIFFAYATFSMLTSYTGFASLFASLPWYLLFFFPWFFALEVSAFRIKEGE